MRKIFTLISITSCLISIGQRITTDSENNQNHRIVFRCGGTPISDQPLLIVDGVPYENNYINKLDPNDIESIAILKSPPSSTIYGCRASSGVIIITTKSSKLRKFIIKDFAEGKIIPGATVKIKSQTNKNDSMILAANDSGIVSVNKLKPGDSYDIEVSSVGFKPYSFCFKNLSVYNEQTIFLEKKINTLSEVIVIAEENRTIHCGFCCKIIRDSSLLADMSKQNSNLKIYPNPIQRGSQFNLELSTNNSSVETIRIFSLAGSLIYQQKIRNEKWKTLSIASERKWAAGTYIVQVADENGKSLGQQKLVIQ